MIQLYYPDKIEPELLNRISHLVDAGYLHDISSEDKGDYNDYDHQFTVNDNLNHKIRVGDDHYSHLIIVEYTDSAQESEVFVSGIEIYDYCRNITTEHINIEIIQFEVSEQIVENVTHEEARLFAFSLKDNGKTGWRLPTYTECENELNYLRLYGTETCYYWTIDDFWTNRNPIFEVDLANANAIAVRNKVLITV